MSDVLGRFIHFGCWNHGHCSQEKNTPLYKVTQHLKRYIEEKSPKPEFITIAGDNYYPTKNKMKLPDGVLIKEKIIDKGDLLSGFECLPNGIKKYLLLGNHDLENIYPYEKCDILSEQNQLKDVNPELIMDDLFQPDIFHDEGFLEHHGTVIIMLDTTMYDNDFDDIDSIDETHKSYLDFTSIATCYNELIKMRNPTTSSESEREDVELDLESKRAVFRNVRERQLERINNYVASLQSKNVKHIIILGHHPIAQFKIKKEKQRYTVRKQLIQIIHENIYTPFETKPKLYYLCADLHLYQRGRFQLLGEGEEELLKIEQYTVGTGGTKLEDHSIEIPEGGVISESNMYDSKTTAVFTLLESDKKQNGFLDCQILGDNQLRFHFEGITAGGKRHSLRTKTNRKRRNSKKKTTKKQITRRKYKTNMKKT